MKATVKSFLCVLLVIGAVSASENVKMVGLRRSKMSDSEVETKRKLGKSDKGNKSGKDGKDNKDGNDNNGPIVDGGVYDRVFYASDTVNANRSPDLCRDLPSPNPNLPYCDENNKVKDCVEIECTSQLNQDGTCPQNKKCCEKGKVCCAFHWGVCDAMGSNAEFSTLPLACDGLPEKQEIPLE